MKVKTKRLCLLTVAFLLFTSFALIFSATYKANAYTVPELSIVNGAYLRVVDTSDGDSAKASNGLRFVSYMDKQEYETLMAQSDITDVKFGILIAPDTATYILNENTVFSNDPTVKQYDWAIFNGETGNWDYSGDGTYLRIMNFTSDAMYENLEIGVESNVYFTGAIIGVKPENLANEWQGVGYMSYTQNGQVKYQFTNKVVRSLVYTAQVAIANVGENAPNSTVKGWLQANYVDGATTVASSYKTEYYLEQKDGTFSLNETVVTSDGVTIDDVATPAPAKEIAGYVFDESNANNVLGETKVLANGKTVFKRYYLLTEVGLVDKTNAQEVNSVRSLDGYTAVLNKVVGAKATPIDATFNGNVLDVTSLDGTYSLVLTKGDQTITRTFDVYDSTQAPEWLDTLSMENLWGFRGTAGDTSTVLYREKVQYSTSVVTLEEQFHKEQFYFVDGQKSGGGDSENGVNRGTHWCFNVIAKHSKAYYERLVDYVLTFDYYLGTTSTTDIYGPTIYGAFNNVLDSSRREKGWYNVSIPMSTILEKWDIISGVETVSGIGNAMFNYFFELRFFNYFGNFKVVYDYPSTPAQTPVWNNTTNGWDARVYQNGTTWKETAWSVGYMSRVLSVDLSNADAIGSRTSGNYFMVKPINSVQWHYVTVKPVYNKEVYTEYLNENPNAVLTYDLYYTLPDTAKNDVRRISTHIASSNQNHYNIRSGYWYTVTIPLKRLVDAWDDIINDTSGYGKSGYLLSIYGTDEGYNSTGVQSSDKDTTSQQITMFLGNFQINASGTLGVALQ